MKSPLYIPCVIFLLSCSFFACTLKLSQDIVASGYVEHKMLEANILMTTEDSTTTTLSWSKDHLQFQSLRSQNLPSEERQKEPRKAWSGFLDALVAIGKVAAGIWVFDKV